MNKTKAAFLAIFLLLIMVSVNAVDYLDMSKKWGDNGWGYLPIGSDAIRLPYPVDRVLKNEIDSHYYLVPEDPHARWPDCENKFCSVHQAGEWLTNYVVGNPYAITGGDPFAYPNGTIYIYGNPNAPSETFLFYDLGSGEPYRADSLEKILLKGLGTSKVDEVSVKGDNGSLIMGRYNVDLDPEDDGAKTEFNLNNPEGSAYWFVMPIVLYPEKRMAWYRALVDESYSIRIANKFGDSASAAREKAYKEDLMLYIEKVACSEESNNLWKHQGNSGGELRYIVEVGGQIKSTDEISALRIETCALFGGKLSPERIQYMDEQARKIEEIIRRKDKLMEPAKPTSQIVEDIQETFVCTSEEKARLEEDAVLSTSLEAYATGAGTMVVGGKIVDKASGTVLTDAAVNTLNGIGKQVSSLRRGDAFLRGTLKMEGVVPTVGKKIYKMKKVGDGLRFYDKAGKLLWMDRAGNITHAASYAKAKKALTPLLNFKPLKAAIESTQGLAMRTAGNPKLLAPIQTGLRSLQGKLRNLTTQFSKYVNPGSEIGAGLSKFGDDVSNALVTANSGQTISKLKAPRKLITLMKNKFAFLTGAKKVFVGAGKTLKFAGKVLLLASLASEAANLFVVNLISDASSYGVLPPLVSPDNYDQGMQYSSEVKGLVISTPSNIKVNNRTVAVGQENKTAFTLNPNSQNNILQYKNTFDEVRSSNIPVLTWIGRNLSFVNEVSEYFAALSTGNAELVQAVQFEVWKEAGQNEVGEKVFERGSSGNCLENAQGIFECNLVDVLKSLEKGNYAIMVSVNFDPATYLNSAEQVSEQFRQRGCNFALDPSISTGFEYCVKLYSQLMDPEEIQAKVALVSKVVICEADEIGSVGTTKEKILSFGMLPIAAGMAKESTLGKLDSFATESYAGIALAKGYPLIFEFEATNAPVERDLTVSISGSSNVEANKETEFTSSVEGGKEPFFYKWTLNGEEIGADASVKKTFAEIGDYTITLRVSDSSDPKQTAEKQTTVKVLEEGELIEVTGYTILKINNMDEAIIKPGWNPEEYAEALVIKDKTGKILAKHNSKASADEGKIYLVQKDSIYYLIINNLTVNNKEATKFTIEVDFGSGYPVGTGSLGMGPESDGSPAKEVTSGTWSKGDAIE